MLHKSSIAILFIALAVTGCSRSSNALSGVSTQAPPQPLPSAPAGDVQSAQLDPISQSTDLNQIEQTNEAPVAPGVAGSTDNNQVAALTPDATSSEPLTHEPLAGAWNVNSDNAGCRAILSFTQWSGGYRATTLRCNSPELSTVSAWDIKGSRVVLVDTNGTQVASLAAVGKDRYAGQTASGKPVSFSR